MTQDDVIRLAREAGFIINDDNPMTYSLEAFAKLVAEHERKRYMQLFLDPENQPTQFGTATQEYREQEIAEVRDLLFALAHRIRTTHLYGMEVQKMLEQAEAILARGQA
jgi:hypothetical protein